MKKVETKTKLNPIYIHTYKDIVQNLKKLLNRRIRWFRLIKSLISESNGTKGESPSWFWRTA